MLAKCLFLLTPLTPSDHRNRSEPKSFSSGDDISCLPLTLKLHEAESEEAGERGRRERERERQRETERKIGRNREREGEKWWLRFRIQVLESRTSQLEEHVCRSACPYICFCCLSSCTFSSFSLCSCVITCSSGLISPARYMRIYHVYRLTDRSQCVSVQIYISLFAAEHLPCILGLRTARNPKPLTMATLKPSIP